MAATRPRRGVLNSHLQQQRESLGSPAHLSPPSLCFRLLSPRGGDSGGNTLERPVNNCLFQTKKECLLTPRTSPPHHPILAWFPLESTTM